MSKHTPGPWTVNGFGGSFEVLCRTRDGVAVSAGEIPQNGIADARLIAAAPDLLEALKLLLIEARGKVYIPNEGKLIGWEKKALAAVAKAEGGP